MQNELFWVAFSITFVVLTGCATLGVGMAIGFAAQGAVTFALMLAVGLFCDFTFSGVVIGGFITVFVASIGVIIVAVAAGGNFVVAFATICIGAGLFVFGLSYAAKRQHGKGQRGIALVVFVAVMIALCICIPAVIASRQRWGAVGPQVLFIVLLTFINAPFDWVSLGLTRAFLRRGLELGGWWPYLFALMDAALAAVIITLLAATMVIGVQAFDTVAVHSGGKPVLPLSELFNGVATRPSEPEYWWLYALLISSMIPSILNLATWYSRIAVGAARIPAR